ncbi:MAG: dihydrodipicolinate synthase family protein [Fimbriimonadaceae bacterium]|nr:dihydrodipicolinate synthase family protein [Fimbriimonadaceae bacterium]
MSVLPRETVVPAALTPFTVTGAIDWPQLANHLRDLAAVAGVGAVMVNGAAGQDSALSRDERRQIVAAAVGAVGAALPVIAALRETADTSVGELAADATAAGAAALLLMPPPDPAHLALEAALARLRAVTAASRLPLALYQTRYETATLLALASEPRVVAVKEGSGDPATFERHLRGLRALDRGLAVWSTHSRWLLADLATGADGVLSGLGSLAADLQVDLAAAVRRSDLPAARRVNDRLYPLTSACYAPGHDPHARMKHGLVCLGRWTCAAVRPPQAPLTAAEQSAVEAALRASGLRPRYGRTTS